MADLYYPAVFTPEDDGYVVHFPDINGCITEGDTLEEAYEMAYDALGITLSVYSDENKELPPSTPPTAHNLEEGQFLVLIRFNMLEYLEKTDNKAVKKTLTIPSWMNSKALRNNINFSQVLQDALKEELGME